MKKIFVIISFALLFVTKILGQAAVDIPLIVTDGSINIQLAVGLDLTATNCIDPHLGESDIPPMPPTGMFDARFDLNPYGCGPVSSYIDYRPPGNPPAFPFTGMVEHTFWYQVSSPAAPIDITYDLPYGTIMTITDQIGGSFLNIGPFVGQGTATIPGTFTAVFSKAYLKMEYNNIGGDPGGPIFSISTLSLNFPQIPIGNDTSLAVTIKNLGLTNTLTINNIISSNSHFSVSPNIFPIHIAALDSQVFIVTNTSALSLQQGTIEFEHNGYGSPAILNVSAPPGLQQGPVFGIATTSLVFLQMSAGTVDSLPLTVFNYGTLNTLYINGIISSNSYFNINPNSVPIVIAPQSSQNFYVTYTSADTIQQGTIEFTHNAPSSPSILNLSSVYALPQYSIHPSSLYFYTQPMTETVFVTNTDNFEDLIINNVTSSNSNYIVSPNTFPVIIPPGVTAEFYISLNYSTGFQFGFINFYHTASSLPYSMPVSNQLLDPIVEGMFVVSSGSQNRNLRMGFDALATDGIDWHLGEQGPLPPLPPLGAFEAQFFLPENNFFGTLSAYSDFRFTNNTSSTEIEWRLVYQPVDGGGITVNWDLPSTITGVLQDIINGTFINVPIAGTGSFIVPDPYIFNKLKILINYDIEIPVELVSFNAAVIDKDVQLDWTTATETNNSGFELQNKRIEGNDWQVLSFIPGKGTTIEPQNYNYIDKNLSPGKYLYRLKQIDFNGSFEYYPDAFGIEIDLTIPLHFTLEQNYPNPFNPSTKIKYSVPQSSYVIIKVFDILGNEIETLVNEEKPVGTYELTWYAKNLPSGIYFYRLRAGSFIETKKMVILK